MIKYKLSCSLHTLKQVKPHIYIKNKSIPLLLNGIRPFIPLFNSKLSMRSVSFYQPALQYMQKVRGVHTGREPENPNIWIYLNQSTISTKKQKVL